MMFAPYGRKHWELIAVDLPPSFRKKTLKNGVRAYIKLPSLNTLGVFKDESYNRGSTLFTSHIDLRHPYQILIPKTYPRLSDLTPD